MDEFDSIIIGSGQAAPSLAVALAPRGYVAPQERLDRITCAIASSSHSTGNPSVAPEARRLRTSRTFP